MKKIREMNAKTHRPQSQEPFFYIMLWHGIHFVGKSYSVVLQSYSPLHTHTTLRHQFPSFYKLDAFKESL